MHQEDVARRQRGEQVFAAAEKLQHGLSPQPFGEAARKRLTKVGAIQRDMFETRAGYRRRQRLANSFNLWQFGHTPLSPQRCNQSDFTCDA